MTRRPDFEPEALLRRARQGDPEARGRLLDGYGTYLRLLARLQVGRHLQSKIDPSDLVQETLCRAHRDFAQCRAVAEPEFTAWLRRLLASAAADQQRRFLGTRGRDPHRERSLGDVLDHSSVVLERFCSREDSPSSRARRRELAVLLAEALERLPEHYREVIILHHLEGLSLPQVAKQLDRSVPAVEKIWTRALGQLRACLGDHS